ncbi:outer membrane protein assembly factor BamC [Variovorax sp. YR216]|uniref:outer membrane protein assembly factor BamC n=1 Tax=Variovorax sp. YR216 TaxID=1882828 RepID=UPI0008944B6F|nr:outer membrane protein assembly factor BamC [Variovorax sp. YR216]SEB04431.1 outer membrane protein assembly factor BamC [Variovorax sp. YR216]
MSFTPSRLVLCAISLGLAACSTTQDDNLRYQSTTKAKATSLATPPDVTQLMRVQGDIASPRVASASDYKAALPQAAAPSTAPNAIGDVRMEVEGQHRWLVVGRTPEQLWEPLRKFWQDNGFVLDTDQPERRIMETDWAESHAKVSTGFVRDALSSVMEQSQGSAEMDRFRTRLEQVPGGTEIYVSHRGMREVADTTREGHTTLRTLPADAELEAEWLRRMMARLGDVPGTATAAAGAAPAVQKRGPQIIDPKGRPTLQLAESFDPAWRHVGLALDRTGFTVEDRNRSEGTYFVRYVPPNINGKEPGVFSKLIDFVHPGPVAAPLKLGIQVRSESDTSAVTVVGRANTTVAPADALRIVQVIAADLQ